MPSAWDSFRELLWVELRRIEARISGSSYVGRIVEASASRGVDPGRVLVSGIDLQKNVLIHPMVTLDEQIRALGDAAVGQEVFVQSIGGQYYGVSIQLTGETRW